MKTKHTPGPRPFSPFGKFLPVLFLSLLLHFSPASAQYCGGALAYYGCDYAAAIDHFSLSNINQNGLGCVNSFDVVDYTALTCNLAQGESYLFSFSTNSGGSSSYDYFAIWIDLNDDFDFDDTDELLHATVSGGVSSGSLFVPYGAPMGSHRMRVRCINNYYSMVAGDGCTQFYTYGATHDYTANITAPPPCPGIASADISNIQLHDADVSWSCNGCSGPFVVEYGSPGFTPGTGASAGAGGQIINTASSPVTLSSLNASSNYQVYVRRDCGVDGFSSNLGPVDFTTAWDACGTLTTLACGTEVTALIPAGIGLFNFGAPNFPDGKEILYEFTPAVSGIYTLTITGTSFSYANYLIKDAAGGCNANGWAYGQTYPWETSFYYTGTIILDTLQSGTTYYLCVNAANTNGTTHSFKIDCYTPFDPCPPAATITCGVSQATAIPSGLGDYTNYDGMEYSFGKEKIYSFTPGITGIYSLTVSSMNMYSGASYFYKQASEGCSIDDWHYISGIGISPVTTLLGTLTAGTEYYLMVDARDLTGADHNFQIDCATPSNPCLAVQTISCGTTVNVNIPAGVGSFGMITCSLFYPQVLAGKEQIFQFTAAASGRSALHILSNATPNWNTSFHYFVKPASGGCNNTGWTCLGQGSIYPGWYDFPFPIVAGSSYYVMVEALGFEGNTQTFEILCPEAVDPCLATPFEVIACSTSVVASIPAGHGMYANNQECNETNCIGKEKIYSFTPAVSGTYAIQVISSNSTNIKYLFKNATSGCNDAGWQCWTSATYGYGTGVSYYSPGILLAGQTYYIMLDAANPVLSEHTFIIVCPQPTDPCSSIASISCGSLNAFSNPAGIGALNPPLNPNAYFSYSTNYTGRESIFEFTPTVSGNHLLDVSTALSFNAVGYFIKEASGGCTNDDWNYIDGIYYPKSTPIPITLQAGVSYYILADSYTLGQTFSIVCPETAYDPCSNITAIAGCGISMISNHDPGLGGLAFVSPCAPGPGKENVFSFTPSTSGYYGYEATSSTGNTFAYIKAASTGCTTGGWQCITSMRMPLYLNAGTEYYILVDVIDTLGASQTFNLICPPPALCDNIAVLSGCGYENLKPDSMGYGFNNYNFPACDYAYYVDNSPQGIAKVYSYTPSQPGISKMTMINFPYSGPYVRFYIKPASLGCDENNWTCIVVSFDNTWGQLPYVLTQGTAYYLLVVADNFYGTYGDFSFGFECPASCPQYADNDLDGYGSNTTVYSCLPTYGYVYVSGDCNDNASAVNPAATEICNNTIDDNCDGNVDEGCSTEGGNIYPSTTTSCANFSGGTAQPTNSMCYLVKKGKVSASTPGVISYFLKVNAPVSGTFQVEVRQTNSGGLPLLHVSATNQIKAFTSSCLQLASSGTETYSASLQKAIVTITGATAGQTYYVSVKYDVHSIVGASSPPASCTYSFTAYTVAGAVTAQVSNSTANVVAQSGCTIARMGDFADVTKTDLHAFPNPFTHSTTVGFVLPENDRVTVKLVDIAGRELAVLYDGSAEAGVLYEQNFDGSLYDNGVYFLVLTSQSGERQTLKLLLNK